ncbi:hypothetical protein [Streptomyces termitum]|uniref:hypothetical protein n=1 Tax=Streptomyces termitum TaxID=67368 RepID=UPI0033B44D2C
MRRRCRLAGRGRAARGRAEVYRLADEAILAGHGIGRVTEDDAVLVVSELVTHLKGVCVVELALTGGEVAVRVEARGARLPSPARSGQRVCWWEVVTRLAHDITVDRATVAGGVVVLARIGPDAGP